MKRSHLVWVVTQHFLICIGGIALVDFIVTLRMWTAIIASVIAGVAWTVLYKLEKGVLERWANRARWQNARPNWNENSRY